MKTPCKEHAKYIGGDLTDGYARSPRAADICGLDPQEGRLVARFWTWTYESGIADVSALVPEVTAARGTVLDGPHALANKGAALRECERLTAAAGKTPGDFPEPTRPFAGFIRTSVELFAALDKAGVSIGADPLSGPRGAAAEHFPAATGHAW